MTNNYDLVKTNLDIYRARVFNGDEAGYRNQILYFNDRVSNRLKTVGSLSPRDTMMTYFVSRYLYNYDVSNLQKQVDSYDPVYAERFVNDIIHKSNNLTGIAEDMKYRPTSSVNIGKVESNLLLTNNEYLTGKYDIIAENIKSRITAMKAELMKSRYLMSFKLVDHSNLMCSYSLNNYNKNYKNRDGLNIKQLRLEYITNSNRNQSNNQNNRSDSFNKYFEGMIDIFIAAIKSRYDNEEYMNKDFPDSAEHMLDIIITFDTFSDYTDDVGRSKISVDKVTKEQMINKLYDPNNEDNMCFYMCLLKAIPNHMLDFIRSESNERFNEKSIENINDAARLLALLISQKSSGSICFNSGVDVKDIKIIEDILQCNIRVYKIGYRNTIDNIGAKSELVYYNYKHPKYNADQKTRDDSNCVMLLLDQGHYYAIIDQNKHTKNITSFMHCSYFCKVCCYGTSKNTSFNSHKCENNLCNPINYGACRLCNTDECPELNQNNSLVNQNDSSISCSDCDKSFRYKICFDNHQKQCMKNNEKTRCKFCGIKRYYDNKTKSFSHKCGYGICPRCGKTHSLIFNGEDICDITSKQDKQNESNHNLNQNHDHNLNQNHDHNLNQNHDHKDHYKLVFYDLETVQIRQSNGKIIQVPNLACMLEMTLSKDDFSIIDQNKVNFITYNNPLDCTDSSDRSDRSVMNDMCRYIFVDNFERFNGYKFIAHFGGRFDLQFIIGFITRNTEYGQDLDINICPSGSGIIMCTVSHKVKPFCITFIDSFRHIQTSISNFEKDFKLSDKFKDDDQYKSFSKGHFPYRFNTFENMQKRYHPFPAIEYFEPDNQKKPADVLKLLEWYNEQCKIYSGSDGSNETMYDFVDALINYCELDVKILAYGCIEYVKNMQATVRLAKGDDNIRIFAFDNPTNSSLSMNIYRKYFYPNDIFKADNTLYWLYEKWVYASKAYYRKLTESNKNIIYEPNARSIFKMDLKFKRSIIEPGICYERSNGGSDKSGSRKYYVLISCHYGGCPSCNSYNTHNDSKYKVLFGTGKTLYMLNKRIAELLLPSNNNGNIIHAEYECIMDDDDLKKYSVESDNHITRDNLVQGGRSQIFSLYRKPNMNSSNPESIEYRDLTSMYPGIMVKERLPIGKADYFKNTFINPVISWNPEFLTGMLINPIGKGQLNLYTKHISQGGNYANFNPSNMKFSNTRSLELMFKYGGLKQSENDSLYNFIKTKVMFCAYNYSYKIQDCKKTESYIIFDNANSLFIDFTNADQYEDIINRYYDEFEVDKFGIEKFRPELCEVILHDHRQKLRFEVTFPHSSDDIIINFIQTLVDILTIIVKENFEYLYDQFIQDLANWSYSQTSCEGCYIIICDMICNNTFVAKSIAMMVRDKLIEMNDPIETNINWDIYKNIEYHNLRRDSSVRVWNIAPNKEIYTIDEIDYKKINSLIDEVKYDDNILYELRMKIANFDKKYRLIRIDGRKYTFRIKDSIKDSIKEFIVMVNTTGTIYQLCEHSSSHIVHIEQMKNKILDIIPTSKLFLRDAEYKINTDQLYNLYDIYYSEYYHLNDDLINFLNTTYPDRFYRCEVTLNNEEKDYLQRFNQFDWEPSESIITANVKILPPSNLDIPLLAVKREKLVFDLYERTGSYCMPELKKAIELGYIIKDVFDVHYHKCSSNEGWKDYMRSFFTIKQAASNMPPYCFNEDGFRNKEKIMEYIEQSNKDDGLKLSYELLEKFNFKENSTVRSGTKICLNSVFGKTIQSLDRQAIKVINDNKQLIEIFENKSIDQSTIDLHVDDEDLIIDENGQRKYKRVTVKYTPKLTDSTLTNNFTNMYIGSYILSYARVCLYNYMEIIGSKNLLMTDTDSCIYVATSELLKKLEPFHHPTKLLFFKNELDNNTGNRSLGNIDPIVEFAATGSKSYAYKQKFNEIMIDNAIKKIKYKHITVMNNMIYSFDKKNIVKAEYNPEVYQKMYNELFQDNPKNDIVIGKTYIMIDENKIVNGYLLQDQCLIKLKGIRLSVNTRNVIDFNSFSNYVKNIVKALDKTGKKYMLNLPYEINLKSNHELTSDEKSMIKERSNFIRENYSIVTPNFIQMKINHNVIYVENDFNKVFQITHDKSEIVPVYEDDNETIKYITTKSFGYRA
jgi:hypothetical protein